MRFNSNMIHTVTSLKELFRQEGYSNIPRLELHPASDVAALVDDCSTIHIPTDPTDSFKVSTDKTFDAILEYLVDSENIAKVEVIDIVSKNLAVTLENSYSTLVDVIGNDVKEMSDSVREEYVKRLKLSHNEDLFTDDVIIHEEDYTMLKWLDLRTPALARAIVEEATTNAGFVDGGLGRVELGSVISKANFGGVEDISLTKDAIDKIIDKLDTAFRGAIPVVLLKKYLLAITNIRSSNAFRNNLKTMMKDTTNIAENALSLVNIADEFGRFIKVVKRVVPDLLSDTYGNILLSNIEEVNKTIIAAKFVCLFHKEHTFKGNLILTSSIINYEVYEEFVADGHNIERIHQYIKAIHTSATIPVSGISKDIVANNDVAVKLAERAGKMQQQHRFIKSTTLVAAYTIVCTKYIISKIQDLPDVSDIEKADMIKIVGPMLEQKATMLGGDLGRVEDSLYEVVLNIFYTDTLLKTLYKYMVKSFKTMFVENKDTIQEQDILESEFEAGVTIVVEYLLEQLTVK